MKNKENRLVTRSALTPVEKVSVGQQDSIAHAPEHLQKSPQPSYRWLATARGLRARCGWCLWRDTSVREI